MSTFLGLLLLGAALSHAAPNFTGNWKMDPARSDFGPLPAPSHFVRKIEHQEPSLRTVTTQSGSRGEVTTELNYVTDGRESTNTIRGEEVKGTARWEGDTLVIDSRRMVQGAELKIQDRWALSTDGRTLSIETRLSTPQGDANLRIVLEKE